MEKRKVGVVKEVYRYPVKSMLGEQLGSIEVGPRGVIGDRAYALRQSNGRIVSAKKWANMFEFQACYEAEPAADRPAPIRITLPGGRTIHAEDANASEVISDVLGRPVKLDRPTSDEHSRAEIDPATVFGDVGVANVVPAFTEATLPDTFALPRGSFFDSATMHVLATGTLQHMRSLIGDDARLEARRFRPNIVVETDPRVDGFVEDEWVGWTLEVGADVKIIKMEQALRCVMTTHQQSDLPRDLRVLRTAAKHHAAKLGVFAWVGAPGRVKVGDEVWIAR
ncbi:MAG TPA: MOSC N-terminal beta barrel domain-containing protein [Candidatus Binataceae bacterium]|nr:MOSC N-terminal beta barrel domain-containing protein [Candidatus Binataceae bacterium]